MKKLICTIIILSFSFCLLAQNAKLENPKILFVVKETNKPDQVYWDLLLSEKDYVIKEVESNPKIINDKYSTYKYRPEMVCTIQLISKQNLRKFYDLLKLYNLNRDFNSVFIDDILTLTNPKILLINPHLVKTISTDAGNNINIYSLNYNKTVYYREQGKAYKKKLLEELNKNSDKSN